MTGGFADLVNFDKNRVLVAVDINLFDPLNVSAFFAFAPQLLTTTTVINGITKLESLLIALFVHVRHHQDLAGLVVLSNRGDKPVAFCKIGSNLIGTVA